MKTVILIILYHFAAQVRGQLITTFVVLLIYYYINFTTKYFISGGCSVSNCKINSVYYKRMCACSQEAPSQCSKQDNNCQACVLQGNECNSNPGAPACCPIGNGNAYCNSKTMKCEATRYCREDGLNCPFDDLSPLETRNTIQIIQNSALFSRDIQFPIIRTLEPQKSGWNAGRRSVSRQRIAYVAVFDYKTNLLYRVLVNLRNGSIISRVLLKSALPPVQDREYNDANMTFSNDPRVQLALKRRGLDIRRTGCDASALGSLGWSLNGIGTRLVRVALSYQDPKTSYFDWNFIEGVEGTIDLNTMKMVAFDDSEMVPLGPPSRVSYAALKYKPKLKPLVITQSQGSSIRVRGQQIQWYKWKFMYSMDIIHGLQLFHVRYEADCQERLVLYKMSLSEMFVPYGAGGKHWRWRNYFDAGEYAVGSSATPLVHGQDVPENAILLNCTQFSTRTTSFKVQSLPGCIAAYERDTGMLYKHTNWNTGKTNGRRGRQMVLGFLSSLGNYAYFYEYIFHMDGTLQVNVKLTGTILPRGVRYTRNDPNCIESCATPVEDYLVAPPHQHFFNYRIDLDVDGPQNYVARVDVTNDPIGPGNPDGGTFSPKKKIIANESSDRFNVRQSRSWHVINANSRNRYRTPRGYAIKPQDMGYSFINPPNPFYPQAQFVSRPFWVTAYKDKEQSAASDFPRTGIPYQGLPRYIRDKQSVENADVVTWYTFGLTHTTRPEEWPLMNVHNAGFSLVPYNFQSQNSEVPLEGNCR